MIARETPPRVIIYSNCSKRLAITSARNEQNNRAALTFWMQQVSIGSDSGVWAEFAE